MSEVNFAEIKNSRLALNFVFASMGLASMSAATRLAEIKDAVGVGDAIFGYALAAGTIGGITGNFLSHHAIHRFGNTLVIRVFGLIMMTSVAMQSQATTPGFLALCTSLPALGYSSMNVAVNAVGVETEIYMGRSIMPMFHAFWSTGALTTSLIGNLVAGITSPTEHLFAIWFVAVSALLFSSHFLVDPNRGLPKPDRKAPIAWSTRKTLIGISFALSLGMIAESSVYDWCTIYFHEVIGLPIGPNTLGLTGFLIAQIIGRLIVGRLNDKFGLHKVIRFSAIAGGTTYLFMLLINRHLLENPTYAGSVFALVISMIGFACIGFGVAALPAGYMAGAGRVAGISTTRAIAMVAVLNTTFALVFRPILSTLVGNLGLSIALIFAAVALFASGIQSKILKPSAAL